ncbi:hypothetical protein [Robbsia andropogonis]|uniref:hypothetical protein n=1 Tax=Robbsia andropogonis TaxID=28092 RepID=UPI000AB03E3D|nr:hypothetical protein [Robbsia andropogonis]
MYRKTLSILAYGAATLLVGCTYNVALLPHGPGKIAHGTANKIDKSVHVVINGRSFDGHFVYVQGGSFALGSAFSGTQSATASAINVNAVGAGNVLAESADGHNLRCVFNYSGLSNQGSGQCLTDDGVSYDLQITQN